MLPLIGFFTFVPFALGSIASGIAKSSKWSVFFSVFAILPISIVLIVISTVLFHGDKGNDIIAESFTMWSGAILLHLAIRFFIKFAIRSFKMG